MSTFLIRILLPLLIIAITIPQWSEAESEQWCIADEQTPDDELQAALDWACGKGGADCSKMQQENQPCFLPNTMRDHASFAFNSYYQTYKHKGGSCYFKGAAMITELDPSHGSCHYEYNP
ncbi:unnamed protein product [Arabidopsis lyrata]|uniref:Glycosyl hydrolase family protein 17 n=1 Tax=Arabidopsis lyrata subsp. lyrata TaxID=81972 RepID=D7MHV2_ARALL|nr:glucan endo-1,3-beta-glucosidase 1 [Arabidopsis lyrata subsp. lyrata]EFH46703.1 glycosyl hydrolase family protein 17 [Arabidopsis lyrata subsp. lyrata]CAH8277126.1 unnamed protein product [Arabidopsis lyrata]|eukprot:XP_002870444.1 glucan endo-1,3-beta-glucosidase 1 [Arabidopsis lyrata subsp. lyrata]